MLNDPQFAAAPQAPQIAPAEAAEGDQTLPINLATALQLSNVRPLVIAMAEASVERAFAELEGANVLWLPTFNLGFNYYRHDGAAQSTGGNTWFNSRNTFAAGAGATLSIGATDAIFRPLAARQELAAREANVQSARNDSLLAVAVAYFDVQESRGRLAGKNDVVVKGNELERRIASLARELVAEIEVDRARTLLAEFRQQLASSRAAWRISSARLTRELRLNPGSVVVPLEPPHLQVTLISPTEVVDDLIAAGLLTRPELEAQRSLVQATLVRLRQERLRPLIPSMVLTGGSGPDNTLNGAIFGSGMNDQLNTWGGRFDAQLGLVWSLENLGAGNRALVRERAAEQQTATLQLFKIQDQIADEVVQAHALLEAAATQVREATIGVKEAAATFQGNLIGIGQTIGNGNLLQLVNRPQEAVAALQQLSTAYDNYYAAISSYNRAQFQLYHALGCPSQQLAFDQPLGEIQPVDTQRPPQMAPVCPPSLATPVR